MTDVRRWKQAVLSVTLLATGLAAVPQSAVARDRCRNDNEYRGSRNAQYRNSNDRYYENGNYSGHSARRTGRYDRGNSGYDSYSRNTSGYRNDPYYSGDDSYYGYSEPRSAGKSAAIIGGSAAAGAAVGGVTAGKKGAIIGGALGAAGGLIYDRRTRNDPNRRW
jgi:hypothetical protein